MAAVEPERLTVAWVSTFLDRIERRGPDECWLWRGSMTTQGYGKYGCTRRSVLFSHRTAYAIANDVWPIPKGMVIAHACDVRACCNPRHLSLTTSEENIADRVRKGRCARKLTPSAVAEIRAAKAAAPKDRSHCASWGVPALAKKFGVDPETIRRVVRTHVVR